jgi:hypothetical protein
LSASPMSLGPLVRAPKSNRQGCNNFPELDSFAHPRVPKDAGFCPFNPQSLRISTPLVVKHFGPSLITKHRQNVVRRPDPDHHRPERRYHDANLPHRRCPPLPAIHRGHRHTIADKSWAAGTDTSQGKGQIVSNINACLAVQATIKSTLGPYGGDLLMVDENGKQTITNDGATVMKVRPTPIYEISFRECYNITRIKLTECMD